MIRIAVWGTIELAFAVVLSYLFVRSRRDSVGTTQPRTRTYSLSLGLITVGLHIVWLSLYAYIPPVIAGDPLNLLFIGIVMLSGLAAVASFVLAWRASGIYRPSLLLVDATLILICPLLLLRSAPFA